jgi:prevent-host-death family protein
MGQVRVRELKTRASAIVREVEELRRHYVVTRRGRPVALIVPIQELLQAGGQADRGACEELTRLGEEIGRNWQVPQRSVELLSEMRR